MLCELIKNGNGKGEQGNRYVKFRDVDARGTINAACELARIVSSYTHELFFN